MLPSVNGFEVPATDPQRRTHERPARGAVQRPCGDRDQIYGWRAGRTTTSRNRSRRRPWRRRSTRSAVRTLATVPSSERIASKTASAFPAPERVQAPGPAVRLPIPLPYDAPSSNRRTDGVGVAGSRRRRDCCGFDRDRMVVGKRHLGDGRLLLLVDVHLDVHRRSSRTSSAGTTSAEMSKAVGGILLICLLPFLGILIYMIARPKMTEQDRQMMMEAQEQQRRLQGYSADGRGREAREAPRRGQDHR